MRYTCVIECQSSPAGGFNISVIVDLNILPRIVQLLSTTKNPDLHVRSSPFGQSDSLDGSEVDVVCIIGSTVCVKGGCGTTNLLCLLSVGKCMDRHQYRQWREQVYQNGC